MSADFCRQVLHGGEKTLLFMKRAEECGICRGSVSIRGQLNCCTHAFCLECILQWSKIENSCPICKRRFHCVKSVWARKCLFDCASPIQLRRKQRQRYEVEDKDQAAHTSMLYESGQYTIRVVFPPSAPPQFADFLRYLESLIRSGPTIF